MFQPPSPGKNTILTVLLIVLVIVLSAVPLAVKRVRSEAANTAVDICLDADQALERSCRAGSDYFIESCRKEGAGSVLLREETLGTLADAGKIELSGSAIIVRDPRYEALIAVQLRDRYRLPFSIVRIPDGKKIVLSAAADAAQPSLKREQPAGFSPDKIRYLSSRGLRIFLSPENSGDPKWLNSIGSNAAIAGIVPEEKEMAGYPGGEPMLAGQIRKNDLLLISLEFNSPLGMSKLKALVPERLVQGHTILQAEMDRNASPIFWNERWLRAVRERGNRFLLVRLWRQKSDEENIRYIHDLSTALDRAGFKAATARPAGYPRPGHRSLRLYGALLAALFFPIAGVYCTRSWKAAGWLKFIVINGITLAGGLVISVLLFDGVYMQKIAAVPSIKALMVLPLIAAAALLFSKKELSGIWNSTVKVKHVVIAIAGLAVLAVLILRSGNTSLSWLQPDRGLRQLLENLLVIRPRTKEFLIGQPLLLLGLYSGSPALIWLGMIGQVSIINTFLHVHTPLMISLVRTLYGIGAGALIGLVLIIILKVKVKGRSA